MRVFREWAGGIGGLLPYTIPGPVWAKTVSRVLFPLGAASGGGGLGERPCARVRMCTS